MKNRFHKGFTIIEVSLVIAVAGLIFLMVFVALPGLRTSQRDSQRREDIAKFLEEVKNYQTNNRGALPGGSDPDSLDGVTNTSSGNTTITKWAGFYKEYLGDKFIDPDGKPYRLRIRTCNSSATECGNLDNATFPNNYTMLVVKQAQCDGTKAKPTGNPRKLAVIYKLEGAGAYCSNS
ncbi:type II secretion system protein [Candidatus Saccharibacteria bacterium]|nr:type II secretion system protein [Candidatus Saccharibacteria bacterium]